MLRLEEEAGVTLEGLRLGDIAKAAARPHADRDRRAPARPCCAVATQADRWTESDAAMAASILDVPWSVASYERLLTGWEIAPEDATKALTWAIGLVSTAIQEGLSPAESEASVQEN
jgi:hypothetical protein